MISRSRFCSRCAWSGTARRRREIHEDGDAGAVVATSVTVRPPMTAVSPSSTISRVVPCCCWKITPMSVAASCALERSACSCIRIRRSAVMCGVTRSRIPVSTSSAVARGACRSRTGRRPGVPTSTTRIGVRSPTQISACWLSSVVISGAACTSESSCDCNASMKAISVCRPRISEITASSCGCCTRTLALPSAAIELPPRLIRFGRS
jgi:hypothetical protein